MKYFNIDCTFEELLKAYNDSYRLSLSQSNSDIVKMIIKYAKEIMLEATNHSNWNQEKFQLITLLN